MQARVKCTQCPLGNTPDVLPVHEDGPSTASILFLGEAPGENENRLGRPFVGRAGNVLQGLLDLCGLDRSKVLVSNVCRCRPLDNRTPTDYEVQQCTRLFFWRMLSAHSRLRLIVTLGKPAAEFIGQRAVKMDSVAGAARECLFGAYWWWPMYHPASTFRSGISARRWQEDGARLDRLLKRDFFEIRTRFGPKRRT